MMCGGQERRGHVIPAPQPQGFPEEGSVMDVLFLIGRILFASMFIMAGVKSHLLNAKAATAYAGAAGVPAAGLMVPLTGLMILAGGLMILLGIKPKIGAVLLFVFLIPTTLMMHRFWGL